MFSRVQNHEKKAFERIILGTFDNLRLASDSASTDPISPLTVTLYPDLDEDYADLVVAFAKQLGAREKPKGAKWPKEIEEKLKEKEKKEKKNKKKDKKGKGEKGEKGEKEKDGKEKGGKEKGGKEKDGKEGKDKKDKDDDEDDDDDDEKATEVKKKLQEYCKDLLHAKQYEYGDEDIHHRIQATSDDIPELEEVEFVGIKVEIGDFSDIIAMFPCFVEDNGTEFFITYGFTEDYAFVFTQRGYKSKAKLFGLAEPTPIIDQSIRNRRSLEKIFAQLHRTYTAKKPSAHPICTLNANQKIRLCSLLDNARSSLSEEAIPNFGDIKEIDRTADTNCEEDVEVTFQALDTDLAYRHIQSVLVTPFPCFITEYKKAIVEFLVSEDPSDKHSVFLLERIRYLRDGKTEILVVGRVREIALLKHANEFF